MPFPRVLATALLVLCAARGTAVCGDPPDPRPAEETPAQELQKRVDEGVARGVAWLEDEQRRDGSFGTMPGETALALMALLHSGRPAEARSCRRAAASLERSLPDGTVYGASLGIVALLARDPKLHGNKIRELVRDVIEAQCRNGQWTYSYRATAVKKEGDNSNTQFAILALGAARARGLDVAPEPFARCRKFLLETQNEDGGFGYSHKERSRSYASMTAGGAMMLAISEAAVGGVQVTHASVGEAPAVRRALDWLGREFDPARNTGAADSFGKGRKRISDNFWKHYWLWSVERAGSASGAERLGTHDWYDEGARHLLASQRDDGAWQDPEPRLRATCFALLFFARGTRRALTPSRPSGPTTPSGDDGVRADSVGD